MGLAPVAHILFTRYVCVIDPRQYSPDAGILASSTRIPSIPNGLTAIDSCFLMGKTSISRSKQVI